MVTMPRELQEALRASHGQPVRLADPDTETEYVLLPAQVYDQMRELVSIGIGLTREERRDLLVKAGLRAHWDDPEMDIYNELDPRRQRRSTPASRKRSGSRSPG